MVRVSLRGLLYELFSTIILPQIRNKIVCLNPSCSWQLLILKEHGDDFADNSLSQGFSIGGSQRIFKYITKILREGKMKRKNLEINNKASEAQNKNIF